LTIGTEHIFIVDKMLQSGFIALFMDGN